MSFKNSETAQENFHPKSQGLVEELKSMKHKRRVLHAGKDLLHKSTREAISNACGDHLNVLSLKKRVF